MNKIASLLVIPAALLLTACPGPFPIDPIEPPVAYTISTNITEDTTWTTGSTFTLNGRIAVEPGVTLTIEPGVVVKGNAGTGANATSLVIAKGAKLMAVGTPTNPIVFTSVGDNVTPGQIVSPNLDEKFNGLWGGLIILGDAPISADASSVQIEGIPASDLNGLYGGSNPNDNSGHLSYISIRHGGANIGEGNEINGLTLGGVGAGTTIDNIEIIANQDDGIEFFGGTVDVTNLLVWAAGDDAIDVDQAYAGTIDNFAVICNGTDHGLEVDGPEGALNAGQTVKNGTVKGAENAELADFRKAAQGDYHNIYFFNFDDCTLNGRGDFSLSSGSDSTFNNGFLTFANLEVTLVHDSIDMSSMFKGGTHVHATAVLADSNTVGCDASVFSWTAAFAAGELNDF